MLKIGITGQAGFIGTHLYNTLSLSRDEFTLIPFADDYWDSAETMCSFVRQCDIIVHLAAMNRHNDPQVLYDTNLRLVRTLISTMEKAAVTPYVIMSSSLQEERDNLYGRSKKEGRELFNSWAERNNASFSGLIIPNVFGPFGVPFYNSVISTFSHQVINGLEPVVENDAMLNLIYINQLTTYIITLIRGYAAGEPVPLQEHVPHRFQQSVTGILAKLRAFRSLYQEQGIIPSLDDEFDLCLFNTFRSYLPESHFPVPYMKHSDPRGDFVEVVKASSGGQFSFSTTKPGITRGNHFHIRKVERFCVIQGTASIRLRRFGKSEITEYIIGGDQPAFVDMPIWFTHNITNVGKDELITLFWINEPYNPSDPDTFFETV